MAGEDVGADHAHSEVSRTPSIQELRRNLHVEIPRHTSPRIL